MKQRNAAALFILMICVSAVGWYAYRQWFAAGAGKGQGRQPLYYQDSMHPWIKSTQPGKCTICAMDLTPIYEGEHGFANAAGVVALSSNSITVLNVQTEEVKRQPLNRTIRVAGILEADNTRKAIIGAPAPGRIDSVAVESAGVNVTKGQPLATFYSPDLTFQTRRYIFRDRLPDRTNEFGPNPFPQASSRHALAHPTPVRSRTELDPFYNDLLSPLTGTVVERNVFDGQYVAEGDLLFTIVDCSVLWFRFDIYEQQLAWFEPGQKIEMTVSAVPGKEFPAVISIIEPSLNEATRTIKVRADVTNPLSGSPGRQQRRLRLGMYAEGRVLAQTPNVLVVPRSAVLFPGGRAYAYVDQGGGAYEMRRVKLGRQGDRHWEILDGLDEGERIVSAGNVLIDAQAQFSQITSLEEQSVPSLTMEESADSADGTGDHPVSAHDAPDLAVPEEDFSPAQQQALTDFLAVADGISAALASDNLEQLRAHTSRLPGVVRPLAKEFESAPLWQAVIQRIAAASLWPASADLAAARKTFLSFSTNVVDLVQQVRAQAERFRSLKVYFCPMAPKPGLWFQAKGPLRNPYYGAEMLNCGEEVKLRATAPKNPPGPAALFGSTVAPPAQSASPVQSLNSRNHSGFEDRIKEAIGNRAASFKSIRTNTVGNNGRDQGPGFAPMAVSKTNLPTPGSITAAFSLTESQEKAMEAFVTVAGGISLALAADQLSQFNEQISRLPKVLPDLRREFVAPHPWSDLIQRIATTNTWPAAKELAEARSRFVPFSANVVELARQLKKRGGAFAGLRIYHCPMAPKPGLWLQIKGPLQNPFYGAEMLECGKEVADEDKLVSGRATIPVH